MHANDGQGADMRLTDLAHVNIPAGLQGSPLSGTHRLLRDLVCVGLMVEERPSALERIESRLGRELAGVVRASIAGPGRGLRPRRAA
jgi:hypothetical protein